MQTVVAIHPTDDQLHAFDRGQLDDPSTLEIAGHVSGCPLCRERIDEAPADTFVGRLKAARPAGETTASLAGTVGPAPMLQVDESQLPAKLRHHPKLRVRKLLGFGGMGAVYLAEHSVLGRAVAVKVIRCEGRPHPDALERFQREMRAVGALDHPNIVRAYDAEVDDDLPLLVMEFIDGRSLEWIVREKGPLPVRYAAKCIRMAALGLEHAHRKGLTHRDIKPANLMMSRKGTVKVMDFGLAKVGRELGQSTLTSANVVMGTPLYMAPEQGRSSASVDIRADVYSLGCTLFHLLTGRPPFPGTDAMAVVLMHVNDPPPDIGLLRADIPPALALLVGQMLAKDPAARPQTPGAVAEQLLPFTSAKDAVAVPSPESEAQTPAPPGSAAGVGPASRTAGSRLARIGIAAALVAAMVMVGIGLLKPATTGSAATAPGDIVDAVPTAVMPEDEDAPALPAVETKLPQQGPFEIADWILSSNRPIRIEADGSFLLTKADYKLWTRDETIRGGELTVDLAATRDTIAYVAIGMAGRRAAATSITDDGGVLRVGHAMINFRGPEMGIHPKRGVSYDQRFQITIIAKDGWVGTNLNGQKTSGVLYRGTTAEPGRMGIRVERGQIAIYKIAYKTW